MAAASLQRLRATSSLSYLPGKATVEGTWRFVGGTEKYGGISGEGKFKQIGELPTPGMANMSGGCDHVWGTYSAPGIK
jgi:hypothetical protein